MESLVMRRLSFYKNKKVFITGHTGFKGSWLCHTLLFAGANITGYALEPPTSPSLFKQTNLNNKMHSIIGDVRDREQLIHSVQEAQPDIVFHLAAQPLVRYSYREPAKTYEINVMGTVNILDAVRLSNTVRSFINITTDKVYENREWNWGYRENENLCGFDPYSNSKSCSELVTMSYRNAFFQNNNIAISTARSGNVIGGGDYAEDRIIPDCIRFVKAGKQIVLRNPHSIRPYQHVLECLSGYLLLAEKQYNDKSLEGAYNFGPNEDSCVTTEELTKIFCGIWGMDATYIVQNDSGPHEAHFLKLDCSKSKALLGWKSRWDIATAINKTIECAKAKTDIQMTEYINQQVEEYFSNQKVSC
ncbi:MAG: CDP-glucose 4,6-dehydratase [Campylobacteraceae bacterium]|nr:CDP-glucose 4,6-dehydratase [Campylobacteraceae bacterium]